MGRKLAFDGAKGRLWAVCGKCGRWNLTPIEERWEAIEECERQYRGTITRSSTEHIGLGRVKEGTDLIRVGEPLRPEFAAWRYERFFRSRRRVETAAFATSVAASMALGIYGGFFFFVPFSSAILVKLFTRRTELGKARRFIVNRAETGFGKEIRRHEHVSVRIIPTDDEQGWGIRFALEAKFLDFCGADALHTAALVSPAMNATGATESGVRTAVYEIEQAGSADSYFQRMVEYGARRNWKFKGINEYPLAMRLAFEMAAHEESERAAIEGELAQLEADWREAEEIASIADNLFLPAAVTEFIEKHRSHHPEEP